MTSSMGAIPLGDCRAGGARSRVLQSMLPVPTWHNELPHRSRRGSGHRAPQPAPAGSARLEAARAVAPQLADIAEQPEEDDEDDAERDERLGGDAVAVRERG